MLLVVVFLVFSFDLWLHGPVQSPLRHVGLFVSLLSGLTNRFEAMVLAEFVWLIILFGRKAEVELQQVSDVVATEGLDSRGKKLLEDAYKVLLGNLNEKTNADMKPWKLHAENSDYGIKVYSSEFVAQSIKRWKVEVVVKSIDIDTFLDQVFNFDIRCGQGDTKGWDVAIKQGRIAHSFDVNDEYTISVMNTHPAGGGAISSREFIDLRWRQRTPSNVLVTIVSPDPKIHSYLKLPQGDKSLVRATNYPGAGIRLTVLPGGDLKYESISNASIGGWLPTSVINSATAGAMMESHVAMVTHLRKYNKNK